MAEYLLAMLIITLVLSGWVAVQHLARCFAARHPEFGPEREEGVGCGSNCLCCDGTACRRHSNGNCHET